MILILLFIFNFYLYCQETVNIKEYDNYNPEKSCFICFEETKTNNLSWQDKYLCTYKHKSPAHKNCLKNVQKCPLCRAEEKPHIGCLSIAITLCERFSYSFQYNSYNQPIGTTNNIEMVQPEAIADRMYNYDEDTLL